MKRSARLLFAINFGSKGVLPNSDPTATSQKLNQLLKHFSFHQRTLTELELLNSSGNKIGEVKK